MNPIVCDLIILAILVLFALWGMHRGLVLSLFSLAAVLVALVGAGLTARALSPLAADFLEPKVAAVIEERLTEALQHTQYAPEQPENAVPTQPEGISLAGVLDTLEEMGLPETLIDAIRDAAETGVTDAAVNAAAEAAAALAQSVAFSLIFLIAFVLILILWHLLARALDLVARLPGLHTLNKAGGLVLGAVRGALILFLCAWLVRWLGSNWIPAEVIDQSKLLRFFMTVNPLEPLAKL